MADQGRVKSDVGNIHTLAPVDNSEIAGRKIFVSGSEEYEIASGGRARYTMQL